jgi:hypothetical protein
LIIDPNSKDDIIQYLALVCHIIDRDTNEDYVKTHTVKWWDTGKKKGVYTLHRSDGNPLQDPKTGEFYELPLKLKYRNIQTQFYIPKDMARFYLEQIAERDLEGIKLGDPNRNMEIIIQ